MMCIRTAVTLCQRGICLQDLRIARQHSVQRVCGVEIGKSRPPECDESHLTLIFGSIRKIQDRKQNSGHEKENMTQSEKLKLSFCRDTYCCNSVTPNHVTASLRFASEIRQKPYRPFIDTSDSEPTVRLHNSRNNNGRYTQCQVSCYLRKATEGESSSKNKARRHAHCYLVVFDVNSVRDGCRICLWDD